MDETTTRFVEIVQGYVDECKKLLTQRGDTKINPDKTMYGGRTLAEEIKLAENKIDSLKNSSCT